MTLSTRVFLALGSNLGDRAATLAEARTRLAARGQRLVRASALYETEPVGGPPQGAYLNQVLEVSTGLAPEELLAQVLAIERDLGRVRRERDGPRTLDIDLLLYGDELHESESLDLPHPRLHQRRFVLVPLAELAADVVHPRLGLSIRELLALCPDRSGVVRLVPLESR